MLDVALLDTPRGLLLAAAPGVDTTRYLLACSLVLGLMCLGAWLLARLKRGALVGRARKRSLSVVDVLPLGRKQRLCVVRAYDRTFVLGLGEREVALVAELEGDDDLAAEALLATDPGAANRTTPFAALLRGLTGAPASADAARGTSPAPAPAAAPAPAPVALDARVAAQTEVERRAAAAAREALLAILDERRVEAREGEPRPRPAAPAPGGRGESATVQPVRPRKKVRRAPASADAEPARPVRRSAPRAEGRTAGADVPAAEAPAPTATTRSTWVG